MSSSAATQAFTLLGSLPHSIRSEMPRRRRWIVTMRDRSNNPRPLQKGRNLSIEAIQTVQALKRAQKHHNSLEQAFDFKFRRLLKLDMVAVLRELLRQNECLLALKVFEDIRREYWYKPRVSLYADVIGVLGSNGFFEQVEIVHLYLKSEASLQPEMEDFNALLRTLISFERAELAMECYDLMKQVGCDPDRSTFRILINGLESMGETGSSAVVRLDAQNFYGESLDFLEQEEELTLTH
ncbi:Pentatricopeptide repeat [Parasponia andersonii]|uniref:Pentatricopeptide repeat n=1 Tax=Parasponia andersonii TaxID=3476 RepID=A0A2P5DPK6_PARAD|nr:Pentatricopeptide repeat [Parasponia andersonii]